MNEALTELHKELENYRLNNCNQFSTPFLKGIHDTFGIDLQNNYIRVGYIEGNTTINKIIKENDLFDFNILLVNNKKKNEYKMLVFDLQGNIQLDLKTSWGYIYILCKI